MSQQKGMVREDRGPGTSEVGGKQGESVVPEETSEHECFKRRE